MVSTRRKKAAISAEFIEDSDESDGNETYQEEDHLPTELYSSSSDECGGEDDDDEEEEEEKAEMSELEIVEVPTTPRKCGRPRKAPAAMPTPAKFVICIYIIKNLTVVHRGKKRPIDEVAASDSDGPFMQGIPIHDSPKKPRVAPSATKKPPTMPLKATPAKAATKAASPTKLKTTPAVNNKSTSPSKAASAKKSKVAAINEDDDELEQESVDSDDPRNKTRQLVFDSSVLKAKGSVQAYKKKKGAQDVFHNDATMSDDEITFVLCLSLFSLIHVDPISVKKSLKFISWKGDADKEDEDGNGMILFSSIKTVHPDIDLKYVKGLVTFEKDYSLNVINLSRIDPSLLVSKKTPGQTKGGPMVFIRDRKTPALCVTLGIIADDQTASPRQRYGGDKEVKFITAKLIAYEYERMVAVLCMIHGKESVRVQLADSTLTFATRSAEVNSGSSPVKGFATVRSRATMTNNTPDLPILDAQTKHIKMPSGLGSVEKDLPLFGRQVPTGSIALIGYTVGSYNSKANPKDVSLSMNVLWVAVLAASEDTSQVSHHLSVIFVLIIAFQVALHFSVSFMMIRSLG
ncbi:uncharacterized protein LACBIDRAFT_321919 [Laccaria bicolor S238N-H82]|uniref:Predicted protein n=1 Tax=Laccaria bicolor (strain S238N-H82 / ATCC MYA-4686) TaxID=486041 RepID=B0CUM5_LACBS|nr:uncharacterized protein LACBIDRAFT_321919 [Laccaria bicolor S238N-H82]EDR14698.1 predicted protein [Laccaria bicolor S238N-H82]|eukprot:XP_001875257.1 predicted protein [Laccaria bicolor S238N-H82]